MRIQTKRALLCGILGCLCYGAGDWLMIYGDPSCAGKLFWLTKGTAQIPLWRYNLAMALAFPGIFLYGIALFALERYILEERERRVYHYLNVFGMTPWIALHLFYIMILVLFSWMNKNGYAAESLPVCEGLYSQLSWLIPLSEAFMLPVFLYWFYLDIRGKTVFPRWMAFFSVLCIFALLKGASLLLPGDAFRLGFTNGLMSESMILWFGILMFWRGREPGRIQRF